MQRISRAFAFSYVALSLLLAGNIRAQNSAESMVAYAAQFQTGKVARDGVELYFRMAGEGDPVLILSGGPGDDCDYMLPVAAAVAKHHKAILLEQRGTGRSLLPQVDATT